MKIWTFEDYWKYGKEWLCNTGYEKIEDVIGVKLQGKMVYFSKDKIRRYRQRAKAAKLARCKISNI